MLKKLFLGICIMSIAVSAAQSYCESAIQTAKELAARSREGDLLWTIETMYPILKQAEFNTPERLSKAKYTCQVEGSKLETFKLKKPTGEYLVKDKTEVLVLLPCRRIRIEKNPDGSIRTRVEHKVSLVMVKNIKNDSPWYTIWGAQGTRGTELLRALFSDLPANFSLPEESKEILPKE